MTAQPLQRPTTLALPPDIANLKRYAETIPNDCDSMMVSRQTLLALCEEVEGSRMEALRSTEERVGHDEAWRARITKEFGLSGMGRIMRDAKAGESGWPDWPRPTIDVLLHRLIEDEILVATRFRKQLDEITKQRDSVHSEYAELVNAAIPVCDPPTDLQTAIDELRRVIERQTGGPAVVDS